MARQFMTNQQVLDYLKQQVKDQRQHDLTSYEISEIEATFHCRPWFVEFVLEDGKMVVTTLTSEEVADLDRRMQE